MRILKRSEREHPRVSLILLDWSVRESFHLMHYLRDQTLPREDFEVILIEYYSTASEAIRPFETDIDSMVLLEMPDECYYHKHLMYNIGIALSKGEILMIADSDAMVKPTFLETVVRAFERDPLMVYHMDEFRNIRRDFYPFCYPTFEEVLGAGCINNVNGKTAGVLDNVDSIHTRNYGACMCAKREDIIAIGGADEDLTYLGHVCGPYDMTFRLVHYGRRMRWETEEYLYHTWHPGSDGTENYLGPHDGRNMSTTAFESLCSGRVRPLVENEAIRGLRTGTASSLNGDLYSALINRGYAAAFDRGLLGSAAQRVVRAGALKKDRFASYHGFDIYQVGGCFYAVPEDFGPVDPNSFNWLTNEHVFEASSFEEIRQILDEADSIKLLETVGPYNICSVGRRFVAIPLALGVIDFHIPSHRGHPAILWADNLDDAHEAVRKTSPQDQPNGPVPTNDPILDHELVSPFEDPIARLEERLSDLELQVETLHNGLVLPEARLAHLEQRSSNLESGLQSMREGLLHPEEQIQILESRLDDLTSCLQKLSQELHRPGNRILQLEEHFSHLDSAIQGVREGLLHPTERIHLLEGELSSVVSGLQELRDRLHGPEDRIHRLEENSQDLESALREVCKQLHQPEDRIHQLERRFEGLESSLAHTITLFTGRLAESERGQELIASNVRGIYASRTWRILTRFGGIFSKMLGMSPQPEHQRELRAKNSAALDSPSGYRRPKSGISL